MIDGRRAEGPLGRPRGPVAHVLSLYMCQVTLRHLFCGSLFSMACCFSIHRSTTSFQQLSQYA